MNYFGKIAIIGTVVVGIGAAIYFIPKTTQSNTETTTQNDYSDIYNNIETTTEMKYVQFDTADEMFEYTEKITSINGVEEVTEFLNKFLQDCSYGSKELMLTYYSRSIWDVVLNKNAFPFLDETGTVTFKAKDLVVTEGENEYEYKAKYTLVATLSETDELLATLEREDTFMLYKDFENIMITDYLRNTINETYY